MNGGTQFGGGFMKSSNLIGNNQYIFNNGPVINPG